MKSILLLVEDMDLNIDLMTRLLQEPYHLPVARDGEQGVGTASECHGG